MSDEKKKALPKQHYHGHRDRLRQRFLENPDSLTNYEILELLLGYAIPRGDAKPLSKSLLDNAFGKLFLILDNPEECLGGKLTEYQCALLKLVRHVMGRALLEDLSCTDVLTTQDAMADWLKMRFMESPNERFIVVYLNAKNYVIDHEFHSEGTLGTTAVYPRRIVERALRKHAASLILAHNHPSGDPMPSRDDTTLTRCIRTSAESLSIRVLDHFIIGQNTYYSMLREGDI